MKLNVLSAVLAAGVVAACSGAANYRGQETRAIKALSDDEIAGYLEGRGLGLAKPAELNGYPGPMHTLELADALSLTPAQRESTQALLMRHKAEVRELGRGYVEAERELDALFAARAADPEKLATAVARSAEWQRRIRVSHLAAHLEQTALLTPAQVDAYSRLRGYGPHH